MIRRASLNHVLAAISGAGMRAVKVTVSASGDIEVLTDVAPTLFDPRLSGVRLKRASRDEEDGER